MKNQTSRKSGQPDISAERNETAPTPRTAGGNESEGRSTIQEPTQGKKSPNRQRNETSQNATALEDRPRHELLEMAKAHNIKDGDTMSNEELITALGHQ